MFVRGNTESTLRNVRNFLRGFTKSMKESQIRAAKILQVVTESCQYFGSTESDNFFEYTGRIMSKRWEKLRQTVKSNEYFELPKYTDELCNFSGKMSGSYPAFDWLRSQEDTDCEELLRESKILTRGGSRFGSEPEYARISMLSREDAFDMFLERLSAIKNIK